MLYFKYVNLLDLTIFLKIMQREGTWKRFRKYCHIWW